MNGGSARSPHFTPSDIRDSRVARGEHAYARQIRRDSHPSKILHETCIALKPRLLLARLTPPQTLSLPSVCYAACGGTRANVKSLSTNPTTPTQISLSPILRGAPLNRQQQPRG